MPLKTSFEDHRHRLWVASHQGFAATAGYSLVKLNLRHHPRNPLPYNPGGQLNPYSWRNIIHRGSSGIVWVGPINRP